MHAQCQVGILPLGTGNDLAQILGWGASFDDDAQLATMLEKLEHAQIKMLDRCDDTEEKLSFMSFRKNFIANVIIFLGMLN